MKARVILLDIIRDSAGVGVQDVVKMKEAGWELSRCWKRQEGQREAAVIPERQEEGLGQ